MTRTTLAADSARIRTDDAPLLRLALRLDSLATGAVGLAAVAGGSLLDDVLGISSALMVATGAVMLAYAGVVWFVASRRRISPVAATTIIALNVIWVLESVLAVTAGWLELTTVGAVVVLVQAAAVAFLAGLQFMGLRGVRPLPST